MEIGSQFEEDFFEEPVSRKIEKSTSYEAKIYKPFWYMDSDMGDKIVQDPLVTLKQRANFLYHSKNYSKAAEAYKLCLDLVPSSNNTWKREFLENLTRTFLKLNDAANALEWSLKLDESSVNEDQKVISMNLLALVCHKLGKFKEELEALHSCMHAHKTCPEFWLRLGLCYAGMFKINLPAYSIPKMVEDEKTEPCCSFALKQNKSAFSDYQKSDVAKSNLISLPESADFSASQNEENGACSNPSKLVSITEKCDFCSLGIQIVSSCLIRAEMLMNSGGSSCLTVEKDELTKEKISRSLNYMEVDQSFIDIASQMLGADFFSLTEACDNTLDSQTSVTKQIDSSTNEG